MLQRIDALASVRQPSVGSLWARLCSIIGRVEPVELVAQRYNFLPHSFRWRGGLRRVRTVARVWEQPATPLRSPRRYFEVSCGAGTNYVLFQDLRIGTWHMNT